MDYGFNLGRRFLWFEFRVLKELVNMFKFVFIRGLVGMCIVCNVFSNIFKGCYCVFL